MIQLVVAGQARDGLPQSRGLAGPASNWLPDLCLAASPTTRLLHFDFSLQFDFEFSSVLNYLKSYTMSN